MRPPDPGHLHVSAGGSTLRRPMPDRRVRDRKLRKIRDAGTSPGVVAARALLPVRLLFGGTFLYAGLDKLLDPRFFDPASPASIQSQMLLFVRISPLGALVRLGQPFAVPIGIGIALAEIAIGLGALSGLAFRAAAWGGGLLSILFFLTASWSTRPYYYGPDLPYAAGWITLALAGHGGVLVSDRFLAWAGGSSSSAPPLPVDTVRRRVLQAGVLGALAVVVASLAVPFRRPSGVSASSSGGVGDDLASASPAATLDPGATGAGAGSSAGPSAVPSVRPGGIVVAKVADLARTGARAFTVPFSAPAPLPAGDPAVIVRLADGTYAAFDAVCTHAGCTVQWDHADRVLICPCHGAAFDPENGAAVIQGPTDQPLANIPISVDAATGAISLRA